MSNHKIVITQPRRPPTADEAARAIYGMSAKALVRAILKNKDGRFDRLYRDPDQKEPATIDRR